MPFNIQPIHLLVIAIVALLIFGPRRLPEIGRGLGKAMTEFRNGAREMTDGFRQEINKTEHEQGTTQNMASDSVPTVAPTIAPPNAQPGSTMQPAAGNFCTNCGAPNPADARFCNKCGSQIQVL